jgi:hypothetical protein
MFANDVTVTGTSVAVTYSLRSVKDGNSIRNDATVALDSPKAMLVKHEAITKGTLKSDRHLVRFERTAPQGTTLLPVLASAHVVIDAPRDTITAAQVLDLIDQLRNFLTAGNVTKLLNNEP